MKLKDFDFKGYLLKQGERVGLVLAGVLAALFLISMIWTGLSSGSPTEKAQTLTTLTNGLQQRLNSPQPPGKDDLPEEGADKKLIAFKFEPVKADSFVLAPLFPELDGTGETKRGRPRVFPVEEAVVDVGRVQMRSYNIQPGDPPRLTALVDDNKGATAAVPTGGNAGTNEYLRRLLSGSGGMRGGRPGGDIRGGGLPGLTPPGEMPGGVGEKRDLKPVTISINDLKPDTHLAEVVRPLRVAVIAASFPYKKQIEEFQAKLNLRSPGEVLGEAAAETSPDKQQIPAFRFLGVEVQRRELGLDDKPLEPFKPVDLNGSYRPLIYLNGKRFEPDDPKFAPILFYGLVMPKLLQFREHELNTARPGEGMAFPPRGEKTPEMAKEGPREGRDLYPDVESRLEKIKTTLNSLKEKPEAAAAPSQFKTDDFDAFTPKQDTIDAKTGEIRGESNFGGLKRRGSGGEGDAPGPLGTEASIEVPEYCLVRVVDVTVKPGRSYEYRLRVRMANPNYKRSKDVANPDYAKDEELETKADSDSWSKVPIKVHVDPELDYYAMRAERVARSAADTTQRDQVIFQAHRWLDQIPQEKSGRDDLLVGEWAVADRIHVCRGEYIGRKERVQVPYWRFTREEFVLAGDTTRKGLPAGIPVHFGYTRTDRNPPEAILVDFRSGRETSYERVKRIEDRVETRLVKDTAGVEAVLFSPEGRLLARNGAVDLQDDKRIKRHEAYEKRIKDVRDKKTSTKPGEKPFGPGGGSTGSGS
jgi:hypothetical protein